MDGWIVQEHQEITTHAMAGPSWVSPNALIISVSFMPTVPGVAIAHDNGLIRLLKLAGVRSGK